MQITIKGKGIDVTEALKSHADQRVKKMERYSDGVISASVTLTTERNWHIAEVTLFGNGFDMRGEERTKDMYNSIDRVVEKLERQLKKQREKEYSHRTRTHDDDHVEAPRPNETPAAKKEADPYGPRVEHVHSYVAQQMSLDEAIKEMEQAGYQFYCFLNEDNGRINVVHKTARGYGLVDPRTGDENDD